MNKNKSDTYATTKRWYVIGLKKNFLVQNRVINFHVGHGMIVDKENELFSVNQSKRLDKFLNFKTQN